MDLTRIKSAVLNQLTDTNGLYSLKLQNHIYGCFIIMEDIAQSVVDLSGTILSTSKFTLDCDKQFAEIGLRYGFIMDTKLMLDEFKPEYKEAWLQYFKDIDLAKDIDEVDKVEDALIEVIQHLVKEEDAFFVNALNTGSLPQEWVGKVISLLTTPEVDDEIKSSAISKALTEKPAPAMTTVKQRRLAVTRRANSKIVASKRSLAKTRRHK